MSTPNESRMMEDAGRRGIRQAKSKASQGTGKRGSSNKSSGGSGNAYPFEGANPNLPAEESIQQGQADLKTDDGTPSLPAPSSSTSAKRLLRKESGIALPSPALFTPSVLALGGEPNVFDASFTTQAPAARVCAAIPPSLDNVVSSLPLEYVRSLPLDCAPVGAAPLPAPKLPKLGRSRGSSQTGADQPAPMQEMDSTYDYGAGQVVPQKRAADDRLDDSASSNDGMDSGASKEDSHSSGPDKRKKFLERNRIAAMKCRQKRKEWLNSLEKNYADATETNAQLMGTATALREEILQLRAQLVVHKRCDPARCAVLTKYMARPSSPPDLTIVPPPVIDPMQPAYTQPAHHPHASGFMQGVRLGDPHQVPAAANIRSPVGAMHYS